MITPELIYEIRVKGADLHPLRCETCEFYVPETDVSEGKCKVSRRYDGSVESKVFKWIENLGCGTHSSMVVKE